MKFRNRPTEEPELNLVPLIDVLLMTLIFLVVTTSFSKESQLRIKLPEATTEQTASDDTLRVMIDANGHYYIDDKQLLNDSPQVLRNAVSQAARKLKDPVIIIHADGRSPHEAVVRIMDVSRRLGYSRLTFATQKPANEK